MDRQSPSTSVGQLKAASQELRSLLPKLIDAHDSDISPRVARALLLLQKIKSSTRDTFLETEAWRKRVADQKDLVEAHHLKLQNLMYEKDHLLREIKRCRGFPMKEMDKIEFPEGQLPVTGDPDMHAEHLLRLETEKEAREEVQEQQRQLHAKIAAVDEAIVEKRTFLESLPAEIAAIEKASEPLQALLSIPVTTMDVARQHDAKELPSALYTLYCELEAYMQAMGPGSLQLRIAPAQATPSSSTKVSSRSVRERTTPVPEVDERASKRQKTTPLASRSPSPSVASPAPAPAAATSTPAVQLAEAYSVAPKAVEIEFMPPAGSSAVPLCVRFIYLPVLGIVTVETPAYPHLLHNLFDKDAGDVQPNVAAAYALVSEDGHEVDMDYPADAPARPYLWAQWICGLAFQRRSEPTRPEPSIRCVLTTLAERYESRVALLALSDRLAARRVEAHASLAAVLPKARKTTLVKWTANVRPTEAFATLHAENSYFRAVLEHDRSRVNVYVEVSPAYPQVPPVVVCEGERRANVPSADQLKDMALEVSLASKSWHAPDAKPWLLMHQIMTLMTCLDEVHAKGDKYTFGSKRAVVSDDTA
ncbi:hypothetical protein SPRG_03012 [Saprolegnia parasitica CBS 223.65]|uniref:THO complex subunit 5 n=1 Tax=Saprolegnia parasitica (strain CBS 223.65) TaxID=695850 RepID=A0A067D0F8_SAPPC|nr:hypothetical protein SPRG_03012 [Saprolegnia parasitica CBS 223.65]KDO32537.1 hypothetical protein SPRG_03012 [Saprolegnia parasitica CBS 223.65]|eukprot:XP_012196983.1 hypothetical protein SPRG_03012 [Saprolegnia parasitica CBS 223.65]